MQLSIISDPQTLQTLHQDFGIFAKFAILFGDESQPSKIIAYKNSTPNIETDGVSYILDNGKYVKEILVNMKTLENPS